MKKSEKSQNNKKFIVVVFYGIFAVGKYTVANEFHKKTGFKFFHNHHVFDISNSLFERGTINLGRLYEDLYFTILREIADAKLSTVMTHAYSAKYVSKTGLSDPNYMRKIESIVAKAGGDAYFVHLKASEEVLLKRVLGASRKKFAKLKDPKILKEVLNSAEKDWQTSAPVKNNLVIDNTKVSPSKVVDLVIEHFKLK